MRFLIVSCLVTLFAVSVSAIDIFVKPSGCSKDIRLIVDDSYRELVNKTRGECSAQCLADGSWCRSFSYFDDPSNATKVCALNIGHSDAVWSGLRYALNWTYYERITKNVDFENFATADIDTCQPNTYRDCNTAYLVTRSTEARDVWLKLDTLPYKIRAHCYKGREIMMIQRSGFFDISWNRPWEDYKQGFGDELDNYWFGLERMSHIINQDKIIRYVNHRGLLPRKLNGTTTRLTLYSSLANKIPFWSVRSDGKLVHYLRSVCICEDTINAQGEGHVRLCGCNDPKESPFTWNEEWKMIISPRKDREDRCLQVPTNLNGEEVVVVGCNIEDDTQKWTILIGRYNNFWTSRDTSNSVRQSLGKRMTMDPESGGYKVSSQSYSGCACINCKFNLGYKFSSYDRDYDGETNYNLAKRNAGGDWWTTESQAAGGEPKLTAMKDLTWFKDCSSYRLRWGIMTLVAQDWYV